MTTSVQRLDVAAASRTRCRQQDVEWQRLDDVTFAVALPGERRLKTPCVLTVGKHALSIEAFVMRAPEENREGSTPGCSSATRACTRCRGPSTVPATSTWWARCRCRRWTPTRSTGSSAASWRTPTARSTLLLQLGFASSIRREWAWRIKNDQPLANLAAFKRFAPEGID